MVSIGKSGRFRGGVNIGVNSKLLLEVNYDDIISPANLLKGWQVFVHGKGSKSDVQLFGRNLMDNLLQLYTDLASRLYQHQGYHQFNISDPKPRQIHKASVRDRVLNHAVYRKLYPFFDKTFIYDSYSCREGKGVFAALERFDQFARKTSHNNTRTCWVLKCDIRKFFASIDQTTLTSILGESIRDENALQLLSQIIGSFETAPAKGLPLGNLTSQLFVNIYMNEFDQFVKHRLKVRHYIRYADDFVLLAHDRDWLLAQTPLMQDFLSDELMLIMHPDKIGVATLASGVDFLGWVNFPGHRVLRSNTKRRMWRSLSRSSSEASTQSYLGLLSHGYNFKLQQEVLNAAWIEQ